MFILNICTISFVAKVDQDNDKEVLAVENVRISLHKEQHPDDTASGSDIGLSSENEADELSENEYIGRKYKRKSAPSPPPDDPVPPQPQSDPQPRSENTGMASVQVPTSMLQQVHAALGQLLQGQQPQMPLSGGVPPPPPGDSTQEPDIPFPVPKTSRFNKSCQICQRKFWAPETYRRHLKTHLGTLHNICPNEGCGRKLSSKRSLDKHLTTCQVAKTVFYPRKGCKSTFAIRDALALHMPTHKVLKKSQSSCSGCGKPGFTKAKSLKDHWRFCPQNPNRVGPFPCPVPGYHRGPNKPFERTRILNQHLRVAHRHDPKHMK